MQIIYIDPMSGIAIINLLIALLIALWKQIIKLVYKIIGKEYIDKSVDSDVNCTYAILSEGNQYYSSFFPIVQEFSKQKTFLNYYTLDIDDKILSYKSDYIKSRFLGYSWQGFHNASKIKCKNLICTTPNIGNINYPLKKPKQVESLIHIFHSFTDISIYKKGSLDFYDKVYLGSSFQLDSIREIEKLRGLKQKKCVEVGLPYIDSLIHENNVQKQQNNDETSILIASSWGQKGLLNSSDFSWLRKLAIESDNKYIIRPHPQSFKSEKRMIIKLKRIVEKYQNIIIDERISPLKSLKKSSILISDTSSIRYDYAFIFLKPVISVNIEPTNMKDYEFDLISKKWDYNFRTRIGPVINCLEEIDSKLINDTIRNQKDYIFKIKALKKEYFQNIGLSSKNIFKELKNYS